VGEERVLSASFRSAPIIRDDDGKPASVVTSFRGLRLAEKEAAVR